MINHLITKHNVKIEFLYHGFKRTLELRTTMTQFHEPQPSDVYSIAVASELSLTEKRLGYK